jgi:hypothetical protein
MTPSTPPPPKAEPIGPPKETPKDKEEPAKGAAIPPSIAPGTISNIPF